MSSCIPSSIGAGASSTPLTAERLLEASIPGFSIFSSIAKTYLRIDISAMISMLLPVAAVVAAVRYLYDPLTSYVMTYGTSTAEIRSDDEMYNYIMFWISRQKFVAQSRSFLAGTKFVSESTYDYDSDDEDADRGDDETDWELAEKNFDKYWAQATAKDKHRPFYFTPTDGTHYFRFKGHFLSFDRKTEDRTLGRWVDKRETLKITALGRNPTILKELLKEAQKMYVDRDSTKTVIYRKEALMDDWQRCMTRPPRPLSTVVLDSKQKDAIVADIREYLHPLTKRWYANRGIPYRRGYLLYGPPGTGKTSLCVSLAGMFGLDVYVTSLNSKSLTEEGLAQMFAYCSERCVILLEDVDSAGITHQRAPDNEPSNSKDEATKAAEAAAGLPPNQNNTNNNNGIGSGVSFSGLLNVIDGVASSEGRILIMTTNHVDKLDSALLRPGRVDMSIAFENANYDTAEELFRSTYISREEDYPTTRNPEKKIKIPRKFDFSDKEIISLAAKFASQVPVGEFSPASIQGYLLKNKSTPKAAADGVPEWIAKTREEIERRKKKEAPSSKRSETPVLL